MGRWSRLKAWLPAIVWAGVISGLSTDTFSAEHTSIIIVPILRWLFPHASAAMIETMHTLIRKSAHLSEYFVFSVLLAWGLRGTERGWKVRWAIWAILIAAGYAAFDEFHQSFVPSRTASPWDALLDTVGASAAQGFRWLAWKRQSQMTGDRSPVTGEKNRSHRQPH